MSAEMAGARREKRSNIDAHHRRELHIVVKIAKSNVIAQAHAEYAKAMSRGMVLYRTQSPVAEIAERLRYARDQLNFIIEEMQIQGLPRPPQGIPSIESMEARLEALETLALVAR